jgi:hypothetical protein
MATLTATGINCADGTLDGQYTGTTATNTVYPIGSYIMALAGGFAGRIALNSPAIIYLNNSTAASGIFQLSNPGGTGATTLTGTWRCRGSTSSAVPNQFFQRFA